MSLRSQSRLTVTDATGAFELPLGDREPFVIVAHAPGFVFAGSPVLNSGAERDIDGLVLSPPEGADLELRVKDAAGKPVAGARVVLAGAANTRIHARAVAGEEEIHDFRRVPAGEYWIGAARRRDPRSLKAFPWDSGLAPIEVTIEED